MRLTKPKMRLKQNQKPRYMRLKQKGLRRLIDTTTTPSPRVTGDNSSQLGGGGSKEARVRVRDLRERERERENFLKLKEPM